MFRVLAYGKHVVNGFCAKSIVTGTSPNHQITFQQILGRDEWDGVDGGIYWNNISIPATDWVFHPGKGSTGNDDLVQGVDSVFATDVPHSLTAWMRVQLPTGVGNADIKNNPPTGFQGYFRTKKVNDYNANGVVTDYSYSTNAGRQVADLILKQGRRANSLIDWGAWAEWRSFLAQQIPCDYREITNFDGFGLTAKYYSGPNFDTFHSERVDTLIAFYSVDGVPAYGLPNTHSARFEGYIKLPYNENYTYYLTHDNGVRFRLNNNLLIDQWSDDGLHAVGTDSASYAFGQTGFIPVQIDWNNGGGPGEIKLEWESASQRREIIPSKYLYPLPKNQDRYATHPYFKTVTRLDDAVRTVLDLCNSTYQKVNGKYRFFCLEQLTNSTFNFKEDHILSITAKPRDKTALRNRWKANFRDTDSRFLEPPLVPMIVERLNLQQIVGRPVDGQDLEFYNTNRWQAWRLLNKIVEREVDTLPIEMIGNASTFSVLGGDRVKITTDVYDWINKEFLVMTSNDASSEETADERNFLMQEWK